MADASRDTSAARLGRRLRGAAAGRTAGIALAGDRSRAGRTRRRRPHIGHARQHDSMAATHGRLGRRACGGRAARAVLAAADDRHSRAVALAIRRGACGRTHRFASKVLQAPQRSSPVAPVKATPPAPCATSHGHIDIGLRADCANAERRQTTRAAATPIAASRASRMRTDPDARPATPASKPWPRRAHGTCVRRPGAAMQARSSPITWNPHAWSQVIAATRDPRVGSGPAASLAAALDAELAAIDARLAQTGLDADQRLALWRERVDLLRAPPPSIESQLRCSLRTAMRSTARWSAWTEPQRRPRPRSIHSNRQHRSAAPHRHSVPHIRPRGSHDHAPHIAHHPRPRLRTGRASRHRRNRRPAQSRPARRPSSARNSTPRATNCSAPRNDSPSSPAATAVRFRRRRLRHGQLRAQPTGDRRAARTRAAGRRAHQRASRRAVAPRAAGLRSGDRLLRVNGK